MAGPLQREANRAYKEEMRHARKEERLHNKAARQAAHGKFVKATMTEAKAYHHHQVANELHQKEEALQYVLQQQHPGAQPQPCRPHHHHHRKGRGQSAPCQPCPGSAAANHCGCQHSMQPFPPLQPPNGYGAPCPGGPRPLGFEFVTGPVSYPQPPSAPQSHHGYPK